MRWYVGTSGWGYDAWAGAFYPKHLPARERLAFYARYFDTVEMNTSFYHVPRREQITSWRHAVPEDFIFTVKGSRYITHVRKLNDAAEPVAHMMEPLKRQPKIGPLIFQLPPHWNMDLPRLKDFLKVLPKRRIAIEFRDPSWHDDKVYALLRKYNIAFCLFEKAALRSPFVVTADFIYVRLHGRKEGYKGRYSDATLAAWHRRLEGEGKDAYVFFDNTDEKIHAIENALTLREMAQDSGT